MRKTVILLLVIVMILASSCVPAADHSADVSGGAPEVTDTSSLPDSSDRTPESSALPTGSGAASTESPCRILEIKSGTLDGSKASHHFDVEETVIKTVDESRQNSEKTATFLGKQYDLVYSQTITYVFGNYTVDEYSVKDQEGTFKLLPDGTIISVSMNPIISLGLGSSPSAEAVRAAAEAAFAETLDFDEFEYCDLAEPDQDSGFFFYELLWYNRKGGIKMGDYASISIDLDGNVCIVLMRNNIDYGFSGLSDDIVFESFIPSIEAKLHDIYGDDLVDYDILQYEFSNVDGVPCIQCTIGVRYDVPNSEFFYSESCKLAVIPAQ